MIDFKKHKIIFLFFTILTSCGLLESTSDKVVDDFNVSFTDDITWRSLCLKNWTVVEPYVFAVGHNEKFIIVKQHTCPREEFKVNTNITKYFIVDISKFDFKGNGFYGSLEKNQFDSLSLALQIGAISFDMNYPEQPHVFAR